jgi:ribosomal protein S18 acetylase RimI-like enzyme
LKTAPDELELIKMAVLPEARGRGAGEFLLRATIERAFALGAERLFLLTNSKSRAAIRLYERSGFVHDAEILARCGGEYARCDVAMRYLGAGARKRHTKKGRGIAPPAPFVTPAKAGVSFI